MGEIRAGAEGGCGWALDARGEGNTSAVRGAAKAKSGEGAGGTVYTGVQVIWQVAVAAGGDATGTLRCG